MSLVSIITPVFNRINDLPKLIASVSIQKHQDWELLLIDDGSDDGSLAVAQRYAQNDDRIKVEKRERLPKGASTCRNIGLKMAKGDYLMFLDSDDLLGVDCLQNRIQLLDEQEGDFIVTQCGIIRRESTQIRKLWSSLKHANDIDAFAQLQGWCISSTFFKGDFVKKYKFEEEAPCLQDWGFHLRILIDEPHYTKYPDSAADVYIRSGHGGSRISISTNNFERLVPRFYVFLRMESELKEKGMEESIRPFVKHYLKHLNFAVLELDRTDFEQLLNIWKKSSTYGSRDGVLIRLYLWIQYGLRKLNFSFMKGAIYRMTKFLYPKYLFTPNQREVLLEKPFLVENEIKNLLTPIN